MKYSKPVNIRLTNTMHKKLRKYAEHHGLDVSAVIRKIIYKVINPAKKKAA